MKNNGKQYQQGNQCKGELAKENRKLFDCCHIFLCHMYIFRPIGWLCRKYNFFRNKVDTSNAKFNKQFDKSNREELARTNDNTSPSILSSPETIHRGSISTGANEKERKKVQRKHSQTTGKSKGDIVSLITLEPNYYIYLKFSVTSRRRRLWYIIEAEHPVTVYLVDKSDLSNFEKGENFDYYSKVKRRKYHEENLILPPGTYYLIILNEGKETTAIGYNIYE